MLKLKTVRHRIQKGFIYYSIKLIVEKSFFFELRRSEKENVSTLRDKKWGAERRIFERGAEAPLCVSEPLRTR